ncbi:MAG: hypothetical protein OXI88_08590 [Gammaproteobacteria bacterium]|nr:hypothetical protein [Gammaproteobacteria bacterium]MDE0285965.1 hypothetical protein [Gammaproteobacteria bacterium]MDE0511826.1 hypothetical protein [Gammaproteobacteria bacterium]
MQSMMLTVFLILLLSLKSSLAHAYLDPGSISLALQAIVAAIAGAVVTFKYWYWRLLDLFRHKKESERTENSHSTSPGDE